VIGKTYLLTDILFGSLKIEKRLVVVDIVGDLPVILLELDVNNVIQKTYIYANSQIIAQHNGKYDQPRYFYLHDRLGSVRQLIDTSGVVVKYYTFEPFGQTLESGGTFNNSFMFTGQFFDSEIDEYHLRARQYDPYIYRFTSRDPISGKFEEPLTLHVYLYCINEPINKIDIWGLVSVAFYDPHDKGGSRFSRAALDFEYRYAAKDIDDAIFYLELLRDDLGIEIDDIYILDHATEVVDEKGKHLAYLQQIGNELIGDFTKGKGYMTNWEKFASSTKSDATFHFRGCYVAADDWQREKYMQTLADLGQRKLDAFDSFVNWPWLPWPGANYYPDPDSKLYLATPGGEKPEVIWSGGGWWKRHW
jgi:RHS repeat-associated protein